VSFPITIRNGSLIYHLLCEQIAKDRMKEQYKVWNPKTPETFLILENNRPFIREVKKLKTRRIDWKVRQSPRPISDRTLEQYILAIEQHNFPPPPEPPLQTTLFTRERKSRDKEGPTTPWIKRARPDESEP
jgi:hypothetical protein